MEKIIFMTAQGMATITCPSCQKTVTKCIGDFELINQVRRIKCSCSCGAFFKVILEKRKYFRKKTYFSGKFTYEPPNGKRKNGLLYVLNISQSGLGFKTNMQPVFGIGDPIMVEFFIDKKGNRIVRKDGIISGIRAENIGMEFLTTEHYDEFGKLLLG